MHKIAALVLASVVLASCATVPVSQRERAVERLVETINSQSAEELLKLARVPFVVDRELVETRADMERFWRTAFDNGFELRNPEIVSVEAAAEGSYEQFGPGIEMRVYFDKYLSEDGAIATVSTADGTFLLLLGERRFFTPELFGIAGPR